MKFLYQINVFLILILLTPRLSPAARGGEYRLKPVSYRSCDSKENLDYSAKNLWDGFADAKHKWCCFHAGYKTPQIHWVIMDLGAPFPISRIVIHHEGNNKENQHILTEDFKILGSLNSLSGPWFLVHEIVDNDEQINAIHLPDIKMRYVGLEVTDPQRGEGFNKKQDDWAVRILEFYIYTRQKPPPFISQDNPGAVAPETPPGSAQPIVPKPSITPGAPNVFSPLSNPDLFKTGKKLYYFYNPNVIKCQNLEKMLLSDAVKEALLPYAMERVLGKSDDPLLSKFAIFIVPTLIITDENDKTLKRTSNILNEEELIKFLK